VSIDDQAAALTELSMMEFTATTTAFGADVPGKDASAWISRHRVSLSSMTGSLPDPSDRTDVLTVHGSGRPRGEPGTAPAIVKAVVMVQEPFVWVASSPIGQVILRSQTPILASKTMSELHKLWCAVLGLKRAVDRRGERIAAERRRVAELAARADRQHNWVMQGDPRGIYDEFPAS
jgi:hypothetical protein